MRAGTLRHLVTLDARAGAKDAYGEPIEDWEAFATVHAEVAPLNGREYFAAAAEQIEVTTRIRLRYLPGVTTGMRARFHGKAGEKVYNVLSVINPDERNRELVLMCAEGEHGG